MELRYQNRFCNFSSFGCAKFKIWPSYDCVPSISKIKTMMKHGFLPRNFNFISKHLLLHFWETFIFQPSEALLSMVLQNLSKLISFHYWVPKDLTNFVCWFWNFHTLNYNTLGTGIHTLYPLWSNNVATSYDFFLKTKN